MNTPKTAAHYSRPIVLADPADIQPGDLVDRSGFHRLGDWTTVIEVIPDCAASGDADGCGDCAAVVVTTRNGLRECWHVDRHETVPTRIPLDVDDELAALLADELVAAALRGYLRASGVLIKHRQRYGPDDESPERIALQNDCSLAAFDLAETIAEVRHACGSEGGGCGA